MSYVLNLNKPREISSHRAVSIVKKKLGAKKAGHAGTLDPLAEGVLLICLDEATKISRFLLGMEKEYDATLTLGKVTETYDSEGDVLRSADISNISKEDIQHVIRGFEGVIEQVPPMYSAVKVQGQPLYKLARKGRTVEREPRKVEISSIDMVGYEPPYLQIRVVCSKGTYIRSLANDIGERLGVGGYLERLVRIRVGQFDIERSVRIDDEHMAEGLVPMDRAISYMTEIRMRPEAAVKLQNGIPVEYNANNISNFQVVEEEGKKELYRLKDYNGELFAIGIITGGVVKTERVFVTKPKGVF